MNGTSYRRKAGRRILNNKKKFWNFFVSKNKNFQIFGQRHILKKMHQFIFVHHRNCALVISNVSFSSKEKHKYRRASLEFFFVAFTVRKTYGRIFWFLESCECLVFVICWCSSYVWTLDRYDFIQKYVFNRFLDRPRSPDDCCHSCFQ